VPGRAPRYRYRRGRSSDVGLLAGDVPPLRALLAGPDSMDMDMDIDMGMDMDLPAAATAALPGGNNTDNLSLLATGAAVPGLTFARSASFASPPIDPASSNIALSVEEPAVADGAAAQPCTSMTHRPGLGDRLVWEVESMTPHVDMDDSCTDDEAPAVIRQTRRRWKAQADRAREQALKVAIVEAERNVLLSLHILPELMQADLPQSDERSGEELAGDDKYDVNGSASIAANRPATQDDRQAAAVTSNTPNLTATDSKDGDEVEIVAVRPASEVLKLSVRPRTPQPASQCRVAALIRFRTKNGRMPPLLAADAEKNVNSREIEWPPLWFVPPRPSLFSPARLVAIRRFRRNNPLNQKKTSSMSQPYLSCGVWLLDKNNLECMCRHCSPPPGGNAFALTEMEKNWASIYSENDTADFEF
jgi:hypothetical protein